MKKLKIALILNLVNIAFLLFAIIAMAFRLKFMPGEELLVSESINVFKFFTVDSNLLLLVTLIVYAVYQILVLSKKRDNIPHIVYLFKIIGTVEVGITMVVTVFFLSPMVGSKWLALFINSNLFFHLVCPLLAFITLLVFENDERIIFKETLFSLVPLGLYSVYYSINVLTHMENGKVSMEYDFYGFAQNGVLGIIISIIFVTGLCVLISFIIYILNKQHLKKIVKC